MRFGFCRGVGFCRCPSAVRERSARLRSPHVLSRSCVVSHMIVIVYRMYSRLSRNPRVAQVMQQVWSAARPSITDPTGKTKPRIRGSKCSKGQESEGGTRGAADRAGRTAPTGRRGARTGGGPLHTARCRTILAAPPMLAATSRPTPHCAGTPVCKPAAAAHAGAATTVQS
jgi:hypothetical protein